MLLSYEAVAAQERSCKIGKIPAHLYDNFMLYKVYPLKNKLFLLTKKKKGKKESL